jgi:hypothetical protein
LSIAAPVRTRILRGYDDPALGRDRWNELVRSSHTRSPFLTWELQQAWLEAYAEGELILVGAERDGKIVAVAPLQSTEGEVWFSGSCFEFDRLDFIGDVSAPGVLGALLEKARDQIEAFVSFELEFVPALSPTSEAFPDAAAKLGLRCTREYEMLAPEIDLACAPADPLGRSRVLEYESWFVRHGRFEVRHHREADEILPHLPEFFDQHQRRWPGNESRFCEARVRRLFERLTERCAGTDLLRFTRIDWDGRPIAFHHGLAYDGRFFVGSVSFEPTLANRSPGRILLRHLVLAAQEEGAQAFDFRTGSQEFKLRYATGSTRIVSWSLQPPEWSRE